MPSQSLCHLFANSVCVLAGDIEDAQTASTATQTAADAAQASQSISGGVDCANADAVRSAAAATGAAAAISAFSGLCSNSPSIIAQW